MFYKNKIFSTLTYVSLIKIMSLTDLNLEKDIQEAYAKLLPEIGGIGQEKILNS